MTLLQSAFISIINLSIAASFLMLAVILLRPLLKRVPRWLTCVLWGMVALRLVVPFSFESRWSLVPSWKVSVSREKEALAANNESLAREPKAEDRLGETTANNSAEDNNAEYNNAEHNNAEHNNAEHNNADYNNADHNNVEHNDTEHNNAEHAWDISTARAWEDSSGENDQQAFSQGNDTENVVYVGEAASDNAASKQKDPWDMAASETKEHGPEGLSGNEITTAVTGLLAAGSGVWMAGIIAMLAYMIFSYGRLHMKVRTAVRLGSGTGLTAWMSDVITEPFVLGILKPGIYVPSALGEQDLEYVLCHERAHVRRGDYLWKPLGFLILCVYWFHPLCWISYLLFCRDVEMACDEKATKGFDMEGRKRYCQTLLNLSLGKQNFLIGTVAFGENGTKSRVKAVLNYKKPSFWVILAGILACLALGVFFMTNALSSENSEGDTSQTADVSAEANMSAETDAPAETKEPLGADGMLATDKIIDVKDNVTLFQAVLLGQRNFVVAEGDDCLLSTDIADIDFLFGAADPSRRVHSFAVVDLDRDGEEEVILFVISAGNEGRVILRRWGNMAYAYVVDPRSMWELKTDGTYAYNVGNGNEGFARISGFTASDFMEDQYTYETGPSEGADTFVADHSSVSENEYKKAAILEQGKKKAVWHELNEENVSAMAGDFQRRVTWIDPATLWQQVLKEISEREFDFHEGANSGGSLVIREDGSFSGGYTRREDTYYYLESRFTGGLEPMERVDEHTWRVKVSSLQCEKEIGSKWKEEGFTYEAILPPGMTEGGEYLLCLPGKPKEELPRGILYWRGMEIEKAGAWNAYGIGAIPKTEEEAFTDLSQWKNYDLTGYGEDLALYCRSVYPSVMREWGVKALSPDLSSYLYGKSESRDGKMILTVGVIDAHEYQRPMEFQLNTETSNEIVGVYWLSDSLVGAETHVNPSTGEFFIYDLETGKEAKHYVGSSFAVIPGTSHVMYEENVPHFSQKDFCHSFYIDDQRVYTSDWMSACLGEPMFSDDLTRVWFMEQRDDLGASRKVSCDFDLQTLTISNVQAQLVWEQAGKTDPSAPDRQEVQSAYNALIRQAEEAIYDLQANYENIMAYKDANGKDLFSTEIRWLFDGSGDIAWQNVGYVMQDIDGDGVEELFLGENDPDPNGSYNGVIYDMYTYRDHQVVHLFSGWTRNRYYLTEEGLIAREAESSAFDGRREYYQYDGTQLFCSERLQWEIQNDGTKVIAYSDLSGTREITEKEMEAVTGKYHYVFPEFFAMGPKWSKTEDLNKDGKDDYQIAFFHDGVCRQSALYLSGQGVVYDHEQNANTD